MWSASDSRCTGQVALPCASLPGGSHPLWYAHESRRRSRVISSCRLGRKHWLAACLSSPRPRTGLNNLPDHQPQITVRREAASQQAFHQLQLVSDDDLCHNQGGRRLNGADKRDVRRSGGRQVGAHRPTPAALRGPPLLQGMQAAALVCQLRKRLAQQPLLRCNVLPAADNAMLRFGCRCRWLSRDSLALIEQRPRGPYAMLMSLYSDEVSMRPSTMHRQSARWRMVYYQLQRCM